MSATYNLLDEAIGAARRLMPDADEDAQADFAASLIAAFPGHITTDVVQVRLDWSQPWRTVADVDPAQVPALNRAHGWRKYRTVEIGVCP